MSEATIARPAKPAQTIPIIHYQVAMPQPELHLFEVTLQVQHWQSSQLDLKMPVWTPGSYLVREYARHVQDLSAFTGTEKQPLASSKRSKNHWQIKTEGVSEITVRYRVFANELTVRTNHLDATHGYFNGAALFFFIPGLETQPIQVTIVPPHRDWQVTTPLPTVAGATYTFDAENFDTLVDSPFEIGTHRIYEFEACGKLHQLAIWGQGNANPKQIIQDIQKIIAVESDLFAGLPYERYVFLLHLSASGFGGLEHKTSCSLNYPRFGFRARDKYNRFMQLVAHEFFHLWNVKRIRPQALEKFDYEQENYTSSLWFCEGTTSYYDTLIPLRAGIYDAKTFLENLSKDITRLQSVPGRKVQPLAEASFDAWIKLYRRDANSDNNQVSYYLKGELVSLLLDLLVRSRHENARSLDDVMRRMWQQFGTQEVGFTPQQLQAVLESVAQTDLSDFLDRYVNRTEELPFNEYLEPFGLRLSAEADSATPHLGIKVANENGKQMIQFVEAGSPARLSGIDPGDELLAIDGFRVTAETLQERLQDYQSGDEIAVTVFHQEALLTHRISLTEPQSGNYKIVPVESPAPEQKKRFALWLGTELSTIQ